jgi:hypothetical protein
LTSERYTYVCVCVYVYIYIYIYIYTHTHTLSKEAGAIEKTALDWNPQGYRRRGRPKRMWWRTTEDEIRNTGKSWNEVKRIAGDCNACKLFMDALCSTRSKRSWWWSYTDTHLSSFLYIQEFFKILRDTRTKT